MNFTTGRSHSFGGRYLELVAQERIRFSSEFDDPALPGVMQTTISLKKVACDTGLNVIQEGVPEVMAPAACCLGWQESRAFLAKPVQVEMLDQ